MFVIKVPLCHVFTRTNSKAWFTLHAEALTFTLCCPSEAINTMSPGHFSVNGCMQRWTSGLTSDQSSLSLLSSPSAAGAAAESVRCYSPLLALLKKSFLILLGSLCRETRCSSSKVMHTLTNTTWDLAETGNQDRNPLASWLYRLFHWL